MRKKIIYGTLISFLVLIIALNYIAYNHAYKFTHYIPSTETKLQVYDTSHIHWSTKVKYIVKGVNVPRPENKNTPNYIDTTEYIQTPKGKIEIWRTYAYEPKGTIIMFHGYAAKKSILTARAEELMYMNYNTVMVDFLGSGGSDGNKVTIGYHEAEQVKACYDYIVSSGDTNVYLFGISMGAVAIMKCINNYQLPVKGIILECPFGYMKTTIKNRFKNFGVPTFPMTDLLMLWGSYHAGFNTYKHNPVDYALNINCPTLLIHGKNDHAVSKKEIDDIYKNLQGKKTLKTFSNTGHNIFSWENKKEWNKAVEEFIISTSKKIKYSVAGDATLWH